MLTSLGVVMLYIYIKINAPNSGHSVTEKFNCVYNNMVCVYTTKSRYSAVDIIMYYCCYFFSL